MPLPSTRCLTLCLSLLLSSPLAAIAATPAPGLWPLYDQHLRQAKYIDLTHAFSPTQPVWPGFAPAKFKPAVAGNDLGDQGLSSIAE